MAQGVIECVNCGAFGKDDANFCVFCGAQLLVDCDSGGFPNRVGSLRCILRVTPLGAKGIPLSAAEQLPAGRVPRVPGIYRHARRFLPVLW